MTITNAITLSLNIALSQLQFLSNLTFHIMSLFHILTEFSFVLLYQSIRFISHTVFIYFTSEVLISKNKYGIFFHKMYAKTNVSVVVLCDMCLSTQGTLDIPSPQKKTCAIAHIVCQSLSQQCLRSKGSLLALRFTFYITCLAQNLKLRHWGVRVDELNTVLFSWERWCVCAGSYTSGTSGCSW